MDDRTTTAAGPLRSPSRAPVGVASPTGGRARTVQAGATGVGPPDVASPVRVASVPLTNAYVRALHHPGVRRLGDPSGDDHRTPSFLDPAWLRANAGSLDVLHVHFGFEYYAPEQLAEVCDVLAENRIPLVYTCHDLRNPNHPSADLHDAGLAVWMRRADAVVTLTPSAADRIRTDHGREALVLPHTHVVPLAVLGRIQRVRHRDAFRVGLHLKSLRANMRPHQALDGVLAALGDGVRARIDLHCDVLDPANRVHDPGLVARLAALVTDADSPVDLHVHHYFSDDELWTYLAGVDAFVLPYAFGTHSGLLEACRDLGTAVIAPSIGGYADQGAHHGFAADEANGIDVAGLTAAVRAAVTAGRPEPVSVAHRHRQRLAVADAHFRLYRDLLAVAVPPGPTRRDGLTTGPAG